MKQNLTVVGVIVAVAMSGFALFSSPEASTGVSASEVQQALSNFARSVDQKLGAISGPEIYQDLEVRGSVASKYKTTALAKTSIYSTTTLNVLDTGTMYVLSASGTTVTLPAVSDGVNVKFVVGGAIDTGNYVIDSAEGDNIEGTLIVAGAVVDCAAEDQVNIVADGENIGDYVELYSDGTQWLIGDSGALTASKMTCTDPS